VAEITLKKNKFSTMNTNLPSNTVEKLYEQAKQIIEESRSKIYTAVNFSMVIAYHEIGRLIVEQSQQGEQRAEYGTALLSELSVKLSKEYGKGFDESNLRHMRNFYVANLKQDALRPELSWTHYRLLLRVNNEQARTYYTNSCVEQNWSTRDLQRQINTQYYERILATNPKEVPGIPMRKNELEKFNPSHIIKDPFVLEFLDINPNQKIKEAKLEQALMDQLQSFLLELGKGFSFVGRQYRVTAEEDHFYVDLVFYNYILKCFVLIDLKTTKLSHENIGQMDFYVRYFEDKVKLKGDNPTIGLILCADKNNAIAKYSLLSDSKQIFASQYKTYLPSEQELQKEIARGRHQIELENKLKE
jgi:predicted nuclease of restriction endonuclease-like (RecB) superfamily